MPTYYWKFQEHFNKENYTDVYIEIITDNPIQAKQILMKHIIKMSRFGIPRIFLTSNGKTVISHSNDERASILPFVNIDSPLFQKILSLQPRVAFEFNHQAKPFIPNTKH
jgi:hypothetical protein